MSPAIWAVTLGMPDAVAFVAEDEEERPSETWLLSSAKPVRSIAKKRAKRLMPW
jgi:hypothetical protein